jgi:hypothetical protein
MKIRVEKSFDVNDDIIYYIPFFEIFYEKRFISKNDLIIRLGFLKWEININIKKF